MKVVKAGSVVFRAKFFVSAYFDDSRSHCIVNLKNPTVRKIAGANAAAIPINAGLMQYYIPVPKGETVEMLLNSIYSGLKSSKPKGKKKIKTELDKVINDTVTS